MAQIAFFFVWGFLCLGLCAFISSSFPKMTWMTSWWVVGKHMVVAAFLAQAPVGDDAV